MTGYEVWIVALSVVGTVFSAASTVAAYIAIWPKHASRTAGRIYTRLSHVAATREGKHA